MIAFKPFPAHRSADLGIAQDCAKEILRTDICGLSNNKTMGLLKSSERVVKLLDAHSSPDFDNAAWDFNLRVVTACERHPFKWKTEPWCLPESTSLSPLRQPGRSQSGTHSSPILEGQAAGGERVRYRRIDIDSRPSF